MELLPHFSHLWHGLLVTIWLFLGGSVLACLSTLAAGLALVSRDILLRRMARIYVETFRGTSALVQLFWFYFAFPILLGIDLGPMTVGMLVLGLNIGAYGAEIVRGAVQAVPQGQHIAAIALNLSRYQRMRYVILPQAFLAMLPPFGNLLIELLKSTALVSMIAVTDLTRAGLNIRDNTLQTTEIFILLLGIYFLLSAIISFGIRRLERRLTAGTGYGRAASA